MDARAGRAAIGGSVLLSGFAGLVYQVAWCRELAFVLGSSEIAIVAVLASFLTGLGLGAHAASRVRPSRPLLVYGLLEIGVALSAFAIPHLLPSVQRLEVRALGRSGDASAGISMLLFDLAAALALLVVPTVFMGATLPLVSELFVRDDRGIGTGIALLYAVNTAGATAGAALAGFLLIPLLGLRGTEQVAMAANGMAAIGALLLSSRRASPREPVGRPGLFHPVLFAVAISGAASLCYEVVFARLLAQIVGSTLQGFASILAVFLAGIALGGAAATTLTGTPERALRGLAHCQSFIAVAAVGGFACLDRFAEAFARDRPMAAVAMTLPIALFAGASFPLAVRAIARDPRGVASVLGRAYAFSTLGSIAGTVATGFVLLPWLGYEGTVACAAATNLLLGLVVATSAGKGWTSIAGSVASAGVLGLLWPAPPARLLALGPLGAAFRGRLVHAAAGRSSTITLYDVDGAWQLATNGLAEGAIQPLGAPPARHLVTSWLGCAPILARPDTDAMLVIGFGAGETLEAIPETVQRLDVVEIEPAVLEANALVARERRVDPLSDPRVKVISNDARAFLTVTERRYGAIVSQPSHPWTMGSAPLYTLELLHLARERLVPGGVYVQWVALAHVDEPLLRTLAATFAAAFPHAIALRPPTGAALLFMGSNDPFAFEETIPRAVQRSPLELARLGISCYEDVAAAWVLDEEGIARLAAGSSPNRDLDNVLESRSLDLHASLAQNLGEAALAPFDPLPSRLGRIDAARVIRKILARGPLVRARRLALGMPEGPQRSTCLGLVAIAAGRTEMAERLLGSAIAGAPGAPEPRAALLGLASRRGEPPSVLGELTPREAAIATGWRSLRSHDSRTLGENDPALATIDPCDPLFPDAARLRAAWRLDRGGAKDLSEACAILDVLLPGSPEPDDWAMRAEAAASSGHPRAALAILSDLARIPSERLRQRAATILSRIPEDPLLAELRAEVARQLATGTKSPRQDDGRSLPPR
ncbi:MAG: fused MFS/spermidine synthase [Acidobacteriota bacterium]